MFKVENTLSFVSKEIKIKILFVNDDLFDFLQSLTLN